MSFKGTNDAYLQTVKGDDGQAAARGEALNRPRETPF